MTNPQFLMLVITGPSGAGKSSILKALPEEEFYFSVSHTTRAPRPGEVHGKDYYFISEKEFKEKIEKGEFLEWVKVHDTYYGTSKAEIEKAFSQGKHIVFDIEINGATRLKYLFKEQAVFVFIAPPDFSELEKRLLKRGTESKEKIEKRLLRAKEELKFIPWFDYVIINEDLETSISLLKSIIVAESARPYRLKALSLILNQVL